MHWSVYDAGMARTVARGLHGELVSPARREFGTEASNPRAEVRLLPGPSGISDRRVLRLIRPATCVGAESAPRERARETQALSSRSRCRLDRLSGRSSSASSRRCPTCPPGRARAQRGAFARLSKARDASPPPSLRTFG